VKGRQIFIHAIRLVFDNLRDALQISAALYVVQWIVALALGLTVVKAVTSVNGDQSAALMAMRALFGPALLVMLVVMIAAIWIGVAWHRFILKTEKSPSLVPVFEGRRMLAYLGTGLAIVAIMALPAVMLGTVVGTALRVLAPWTAAPTPSLPAVLVTLVAQVGVQTVLGAFGLRLGSVLAGVALEPGHKLLDGWMATRGETPVFLELAFYCAASLAVIDLIGLLVMPGNALLQAVWGFVVQWIITMVGISILTTLYGHYIEKRPLR
jgi:hypothetical protein